MEINLDELPERMLQMDESGFREFAAAFGDRFRRLFGSLGLGPADAEMLAVSCVTDIALKVRRFAPRGRGSFERWVFKLAYLACADEWRNRDPARAIPDWAEIPSRPPSGVESSDDPAKAVRDAVDQLSEPDQTIVRLRHLEQELSFAEIGARLGLTEVAARVRHHRALKRLEALLGDHPTAQAGWTPPVTED